MFNALLSLVLLLLAFAFFGSVVVTAVAAIAGHVFHVWGTTSAWEWISEALRRLFVGGIRRRFIRAVIAQRDVGVDRARRTYAYLAVSVSPADVPALTGPGADLARVAVDAAKAYVRHARATGLLSDVLPQVVVIPEDWVRRGSVKARPVGGPEFADLWCEMLAWTHEESAVVPVVLDDEPGTQLLPNSPTTGTVGPATQALDPEGAETRVASSPQLVLADARGTHFPVGSASVVVGRSNDCAVRLDNPEVSREHANVYFQEGTWWLRDRGSRFGTTIDGRQVRGAGPVRLDAGSRIVLGSDATGEALTITEIGGR